MTAEPIDTTATEQPEHRPTVAALAPRENHSDALVRPAASTQATLDAYRAYQELYTQLLSSSDFLPISGKRFPKKSAWRKLGVAFGVDLTIKERIYERNEQGRIIRAEFVATATAPNGRHSDGFGACDLFEKCCRPGCSKSGRHQHCKPTCDGTIHFSNPQHDIPATAETRAKNRACSDLFGMGEVSAEELVGDVEGWWGGWDSEEEMREAHDPIVAMAKELPLEAREESKAWREEHGFKKLPLPKDDFKEWATYVQALALQASDHPAEDAPAYDEEGQDAPKPDPQPEQEGADKPADSQPEAEGSTAAAVPDLLGNLESSLERAKEAQRAKHAKDQDDLADKMDAALNADPDRVDPVERFKEQTGLTDEAAAPKPEITPAYTAEVIAAVMDMDRETRVAMLGERKLPTSGNLDSLGKRLAEALVAERWQPEAGTLL